MKCWFNSVKKKHIRHSLQFSNHIFGPKLCHSYGFLTNGLFQQSLIWINNKRHTWNGESTKKITDHTFEKGRVLKIRKKISIYKFYYS